MELCCAVLAVGSEDGVPCVELCGCDSVVSREEAAVVAADGVFIFVAAGYDAALGWVGERAGYCCGSGGCAAGTGRAAGDLDAIIVSVVFWRLGDVCRWVWKFGSWEQEVEKVRTQPRIGWCSCGHLDILARDSLSLYQYCSLILLKMYL